MASESQTSGSDKPSQVVKVSSLPEVINQLCAANPEFANEWKRSAIKRAIGAVLYAMRTSKGLTQAQVASQCGWRPTMVSKLESSRGEIPTPQTLAKAAAATGGRVGYVFDVDGVEYKVWLPLEGEASAVPPADVTPYRIELAEAESLMSHLAER